MNLISYTILEITFHIEEYFFAWFSRFFLYHDPNISNTLLWFAPYSLYGLLDSLWYSPLSVLWHRPFRRSYIPSELLRVRSWGESIEPISTICFLDVRMQVMLSQDLARLESRIVSLLLSLDSVSRERWDILSIIMEQPGYRVRISTMLMRMSESVWVLLSHEESSR